MLLQATVGRWATETLVFDELLQEPAIGGSSESEAEEVRHSSGRPLSRPPPTLQAADPHHPNLCLLSPLCDVRDGCPTFGGALQEEDEVSPRPPAQHRLRLARSPQPALAPNRRARLTTARYPTAQPKR